MALIESIDPASLPPAERGMLEGAGPVALLGALANSAGALAAQGVLSAQVGRNSLLDARLRELAILQVARSLRCHYVFVHHVDRALSGGATPDEVRAIASGWTARSGTDEGTLAVLAFARNAAFGTCPSDAVTWRLRDMLPADQRTDLLIATTFYGMVARQCQLLGLKIEPALTGIAEVYPFSDI